MCSVSKNWGMQGAVGAGLAPAGCWVSVAWRLHGDEDTSSSLGFIC